MRKGGFGFSLSPGLIHSGNEIKVEFTERYGPWAWLSSPWILTVANLRIIVDIL